MTWSKVPIKKRLHTLSARPLTQLLSDHQSAKSLSSVTQQLKSLSSVPQQRKRQQCGSPFDPSVNDFLESSEDEDQTDDSTEDFDVSTSIFNDDECFGPKVSDALAKRINEAFSKKPIESKFKALAERLIRESRMISLGHQESLMSGYRKLRNLQSTRLRRPLNLLFDERKKRQSWTRNYCSITCAILCLSLAMLLFRSH